MKKKKRPADINKLATSIVQAATTDEPEEKNPKVAIGRKGGKKGGRSRAAKLTPEQRAEIAKLAARARWKKTDVADPDQEPEPE